MKKKIINIVKKKVIRLTESDLQKIRDISAQISALIQPAPHTEAAKCAKEVALVEEAMINYSRENLGSEIVDPFVSIEDKLPLLEQLAAAAAGTGAVPGGGGQARRSPPGVGAARAGPGRHRPYQAGG